MLGSYYEDLGRISSVSPPRTPSSRPSSPHIPIHENSYDLQAFGRTKTVGAKMPVRRMLNRSLELDYIV